MEPSTVLEGRYRLATVVARGDCSRVFAAQDVLLGTDVAVKVLEGLEPGIAVSRALRAARAAGRVVDRRVTPVLDVASGDLPFLTMPLYDARSLATILQRGSLRRELALALADDILGGLAAIHAGGSVHRDVRAENVLVSVDGSARLTSVGLTKASADPVLGLRVDEEALSPSFPARTTAGRLSDPRYDVAAAAALLRPLLGDLVDERIDEVLRIAGNSEPRRRYLDAAAFREALVAARSGPARPDRGGRPSGGAGRDAAGPRGGSSALGRVPEAPDPATTTMRLGLSGQHLADPASKTIAVPPVAFGPPPPPLARRGAFVAVGLVVLLAVVLLLVLRSGGDTDRAAAIAEGPDRPDRPAAEEFVEEQPARVPGVDAPRLDPPEVPRPTLQEVVEAAPEGESEAVSDVVERLRGLDGLGPAERAAEIAELYGTAAVAVANDEDWSAYAGQVAAFLRPELTPAGVLALAGREPAPIDPFVQRLLQGLQSLGGLDAAGQTAAANELMPELQVTVAEETVSPEFGAATAEVLLRAAEGVAPPPAPAPEAAPPPAPA